MITGVVSVIFAMLHCGPEGDFSPPCVMKREYIGNRQYEVKANFIASIRSRFPSKRTSEYAANQPIGKQ